MLEPTLANLWKKFSFKACLLRLREIDGSSLLSGSGCSWPIGASVVCISFWIEGGLLLPFALPFPRCSHGMRPSDLEAQHHAFILLLQSLKPDLHEIALEHAYRAVLPRLQCQCASLILRRHNRRLGQIWLDHLPQHGRGVLRSNPDYIVCIFPCM